MGNSSNNKKAPNEREQDGLIRLERNMDALPIWAPSTYAQEPERKYDLPWRSEKAEVRVQSSGRYGQLRSFDKIVLTALVHLWNKQGRDVEGWVHFQIIDIINILERENSGELYQQIKNSLNRLRGSLIQYFESFYDKEGNEWVSNPNASILNDLWIIEPRKVGEMQQGAFTQFTRAQLDLKIIQNLLGNYTRPVSLQLLQNLSERGVLFESYVSSVLYRNEHVSKDIFDLWEQLGLSTKGIEYGSKLAYKMKKDLDKLCADETCLLGRYDFTDSKSKAKSKNLNLHREENVAVIPESTTKDTPESLPEPAPSVSEETERLVEEIRFRLDDASENDANIRRIVQQMPKHVIEQGIFDAYGRKKDGQINNAAAYFVGIMKNKAEELNINLGLTAHTDSNQSINAPAGEQSEEQGREEEKLSNQYEQYRRREMQAFLDNLPAGEQKKIEGLAEARVKTETQLDPDYPGFDQSKRYYIQEIIADRLQLDSFEDFKERHN